ncbi:MAG: DUF4157 domain-containing protein, partial [Bacteroidota bacterium]
NASPNEADNETNNSKDPRYARYPLLRPVADPKMDLAMNKRPKAETIDQNKLQFFLPPELQLDRQPLQMQEKSPQTDLNSETQSSNEVLRANQSGVDGELMHRFEQVMQQDFANVEFVKNSSKATELNANAFALGNRIHFAPGKFNPNSEKGQSLIGHELAHVMQQREGRVNPEGEQAGLQVNRDEALEAEADTLSASALHLTADQLISLHTTSNHQNTVKTKAAQMEDAGGENLEAYRTLLQTIIDRKAEYDSSDRHAQIKELVEEEKGKMRAAAEEQEALFHEQYDTAVEACLAVTDRAHEMMSDWRIRRAESLDESQVRTVGEVEEIIRGKDQKLEEWTTEVGREYAGSAEERQARAEAKEREHAEALDNATEDIVREAEDTEESGVDPAAASEFREGAEAARDENQQGLRATYLEFADWVARQSDSMQDTAFDISEGIGDWLYDDSHAVIEDIEARTLDLKLNFEGHVAEYLIALDDETIDVIDSLQASRAETSGMFQQYCEAGEDTLDNMLWELQMNMDREGEDFWASIDALVLELETVGWAEIVVEEAEEELMTAIETYEDRLDQFFTDIERDVPPHTEQIIGLMSELNQQVTGILEPFVADFDSEVTGQVEARVAVLEAEAQAAMEDLDGLPGEADAFWDEGVDEALSEVDEQFAVAEEEHVDVEIQFYAELDQGVADFSERLDIQFEALPKADQGWLEWMWDNFVASIKLAIGVVVGLAHGLIKLIADVMALTDPAFSFPSEEKLATFSSLLLE